MAEEVKSKDLATQLQKKILTKMASKKLSKLLIDDKTSCILDELYNIVKDNESKKKANKVLKDLIKIIIKIAILQRNDKFNDEEAKTAKLLQAKTKLTALTIISFCEVEHSYDSLFLSKHITEMRGYVHKLVECHLKGKSKESINTVFNLLGDTDFLDKLFKPDGVYNTQFQSIYSNIKELVDTGVL